jgi:uncharacterized membrane protein YoaK (UPF0700 family)
VNVRTTGMLVALTLCAGYVDAVAFFGLGVFTANMTGNTVLLGGAIAARALGMHLPGAIGIVLPALSIVAFAVGAVVAAIALRGETGRPPVRTISMLAAIVALFGGAALLRHAGIDAAVAVALLSAAMGVQSVVAVRAGVPGVSTTFVTGTLVTAIVGLEGMPTPEPAEGRINLAIWGCYLVGAVAGTAALRLLGPNALWLPAAVVAVLTLVV